MQYSLSEMLKKADVEPTHGSILVSNPKQDEEIEKMASMLEAYAEEDTIVDELAKLAVVADILERTNGKKGST
jgi:hypothetical protein